MKCRLSHAPDMAHQCGLCTETTISLPTAVWLVCLVSAMAAVLAAAIAATAGELIADGSFDHGAEQWESEFQGNAEWYLMDVGSFTPQSGYPTSDAGAASDHYAVSDQQGPATTGLYQIFNVPQGAASVILSYDMFVNDWSQQSSFNPNQYARVDILTSDVPVLDLDAEVLLNTFAGSDGGPLPNPFSHYEFDITPFVSAGGQFQIRFLATSSTQNINQGVDNVSIRAVPEPASGSLLLWGITAAACTGLALRRRLAAREGASRASKLSWWARDWAHPIDERRSGA